MIRGTVSPLNINYNYVAVLYDFNQWRYYEIEGGKIKAKITGIDEIGMLLLEMENGKSYKKAIIAKKGRFNVLRIYRKNSKPSFPLNLY